jgi:polysaccharide pyruvyl transferase WcaK-like protein
MMIPDTSTSGSTFTVGLLWHSITSGNLGVGALTLSQMALISEAARTQDRQVRFIIVGTRGQTPYPIQEFDIANSAEFSLRAFLSGDFTGLTLLRQCDLVFDIGEGDSFSDIYGLKRLLIHVFAKRLVCFYRRPLILSPQTIGPFHSTLGKFLAKFAMRGATHIYARDHLSMQYLEQLGLEKKSSEVIDVAFCLPFEPSVQEKKKEKLRVGINVSGLLYHGGYSGKNEFGLTLDYRQLLHEMCAYFLAQPDVEVHLVAHVVPKVTSGTIVIEDDLYACHELEKNWPDVKIAPCFDSPISAKSFISKMDFFIGARMHACIAAFSSGVPVVPMAYSRKFNGLFSSLGYAAHVLDMRALNHQDAMQFIADSFEQRQDLLALVESGNQLAQEKLQNYMAQIAILLRS